MPTLLRQGDGLVRCRLAATATYPQQPDFSGAVTNPTPFNGCDDSLGTSCIVVASTVCIPCPIMGRLMTAHNHVALHGKTTRKAAGKFSTSTLGQTKGSSRALTHLFGAACTIYISSDMIKYTEAVLGLNALLNVFQQGSQRGTWSETIPAATFGTVSGVDGGHSRQRSLSWWSNKPAT